MVDWELKVTLFVLVLEMKGIHDKHKQFGPFSQTIVVTVNSQLINLGMVVDGNYIISILQNGCVQEPHACWATLCSMTHALLSYV